MFDKILKYNLNIVQINLLLTFVQYADYLIWNELTPYYNTKAIFIIIVIIAYISAYDS